MAVVYRKGLDKHLAGLAKEATHDTAFELGAQAKADLATHRDTGAADIDMDYTPTDAIISLVDPEGAELSIEFGRGEYTTKDGRHVGAMEGLHILGKLL